MKPRLRDIRQAEIDAALQFPTPSPEKDIFGADGKGSISAEQSAGSTTKNVGDSKPEVRSRPVHVKQDSRDLLRRLSRSVSETPSPGREASNSAATSSGVQKPAAVTAKTSTRREGISEKEAGLEKEGPAPKHIPASVPKTPVVTGAWIETPAPKRSYEQDRKKTERKTNISAEGRSSSSTENKDTGKGKQPERQAPKLPRSALSAIIEHAKTSFYGTTNDTNDDIGEATIQSLEGVIDSEDLDDSILNNAISLPEGMRPTEEDRLAIREILEQRIVADLPFSDGLPPTPEERVQIREIVEKRIERGMRKRLPMDSSDLEKVEEYAEEQEADTPLTPRRRGRLLEDIQLQRMSDQVSSMHNRTRSLNAGLGRIERVISGSSNCQHCGCPGSGGTHVSHTGSGFVRSINAAFYQKEGDRRGLTWLGWMSTIFMLWAVAEAIMW
jgi:hypothetical protein